MPIVIQKVKIAINAHRHVLSLGSESRELTKVERMYRVQQELMGKPKNPKEIVKQALFFKSNAKLSCKEAILLGLKFYETWERDSLKGKGDFDKNQFIKFVQNGKPLQHRMNMLMEIGVECGLEEKEYYKTIFRNLKAITAGMPPEARNGVVMWLRAQKTAAVNEAEQEIKDEITRLRKSAAENSSATDENAALNLALEYGFKDHYDTCLTS